LNTAPDDHKFYLRSSFVFQELKMNKIYISDHKKGFTLVELLVVISIIALLLAIIMPALGKAREQAQKTICLSNLKQIGIGTLLYAEDNLGFFPRVIGMPNGAETLNLVNQRWFLYPKYIRDEQVFKCPAIPMNHPCIEYRKKAGNPPYVHYNYALCYFPYTRTIAKITTIRPSVPMIWDMFSFAHKNRGANVVSFNSTTRWVKSSWGYVNGRWSWKGSDELQKWNLMALDEWPANSGWVFICPSSTWQYKRTVEQFNDMVWPQ
jgi:prepilin-type N-terminal cleavage/methylation domain-containing protein